MKVQIAFLLASTMLSGQVAEKANEAYKTPEGRAGIVTIISSPDRDARQKPKELVAALGVKPGMTVADVGTGAGYMLPHLSAGVGPRGSVIAEDIFPDFLETARKAAKDLGNVTFLLGNEKDAKLPAGCCDVILVLDAYHHFDYPESVLASLARALKPSGRLAIVEYHKNEKSMPNGRALQHIRATKDEFVREIEGFGFRAVEVKEFLQDVQWLGLFQKR